MLGLEFQCGPLQSVTLQRNDTFLLEACPHKQSASLLKSTPLSPASRPYPTRFLRPKSQRFGHTQ
ncbi:hypothetical protein C0J52_14787 [Blattella germanica]|nr:hypothetical protein C0J52_14787 [Blattella germanica]